MTIAWLTKTTEPAAVDRAALAARLGELEGEHAPQIDAAATKVAETQAAFQEQKRLYDAAVFEARTAEQVLYGLRQRVSTMRAAIERELRQSAPPEIGDFRWWVISQRNDSPSPALMDATRTALQAIEELYLEADPERVITRLRELHSTIEEAR